MDTKTNDLNFPSKAEILGRRERASDYLGLKQGMGKAILLKAVSAVGDTLCFFVPQEN